ncbi:MAG TPA: trypsin-like peptidase domain-containing protein [Bacillaceae bacterium]|nr:trypsin-like peptidase domain-containing protein [Bacillaceae bacterium]
MMFDNEHNVSNITERPKERWKPKSSFFTKVISTVTAGIIGSVLTLVVVVNTDLMKQPSAEEIPNETSVQPETDTSFTVRPVSNTDTSLADMVEDASKAIVGVVNYQNKFNRFSPISENIEAGTGSGVIIKKDGKHAFIVTNNHVIEGAEKIEVSLDNGEKLTAELVGADALTDLAVLKIDSSKVDAVLEFGDSDLLRAGDTVVAIGNPLGLEFSRTVTKGIVSAAERTINVSTSAGQWDLDVIQTDAAINPGNSGGALINSSGQLVGINSLKISSNGVEGLGFAIPSNDVMPLVDQIIKEGKIERPYMGVSLVDLEQVPEQYLKDLPESVEGGVMITAVEPGSAAAKSELQAQDVIVGIEKEEIKSASELRKVLYTKHKIGDKVKIYVYRQGKLKTLHMTLSAKQVD